VGVGISIKLPDISRPQFYLQPLGALAWWHAWRRLVEKVGTSNQDRTVSLKAAVRSCTNKQTSSLWLCPSYDRYISNKKPLLGSPLCCCLQDT